MQSYTKPVSKPLKQTQSHGKLLSRQPSQTRSPFNSALQTAKSDAESQKSTLEAAIASAKADAESRKSALQTAKADAESQKLTFEAAVASAKADARSRESTLEAAVVNIRKMRDHCGGFEPSAMQHGDDNHEND